MSFNHIQTFFIDPTAVNGAATVLLTSVDLYFKAKPNENDNASGISRPGVTIHISDSTQTTPNLLTMYPDSVVRNPYEQIFPLSDASVPSNFRFQKPVLVRTGAYYAIVIQFEDPAYQLWAAVQGDRLVGTNTPAAGPAGQYDGYYFDATNSNTLIPRNDVDLKFNVYTAKYIANTASVAMVPDSYEFIAITNRTGNTFIGGEKVFQYAGNVSANVTAYKTGTLLINASSNTILGNNTLFDASAVADGYLILTDGTTGNTDVRKVAYVVSNTQLVLHEAPSFTSSGYVGRYFVSPVGDIFDADYITEDVILRRSTANSTVRFTAGGIRAAVITAGGTSYTNSNYVTVSGGGSTLNAVANITTNSTGGIISLNFSNVGVGFSTAPTVAITTGTGSGATITVNTSHIGLTLTGAVSRATANIANLETKAVSQILPKFAVDVPSAGYINVEHNFSSFDGANYKVLDVNKASSKLGIVNDITTYNALLMSRSLEVINTSYLYNNDRSAYLNVAMGIARTNTNLFESPIVVESKADLFIFENEVNNSYTNEHLDTGNALSKHVSTKISFANNRFAEDIRAYVVAYKPANTDIKVYARIHNSKDTDSFDDKLWTELELKEGIGQTSSKTDPNSFIELTYGFPQYPATANVLAGTVSTTNGSANVNGSNTTFDVTLAANDLVKIYSPIFPNNYQVGVVNSVTNSTQIILKSPVVNNNIAESVVGNGYKIDKLSLKGTAFNNIQNDNVVRYFTSSYVEMDAYDSVAMKIVLLADDVNLVPRVDQYSVIGVSA